MDAPVAGVSNRLDPARANRVLAVLAGTGLLVTYVETMVVPAIVRFQIFYDNPPISTVAWILSAYLLVGVASTPIFAKLGDIYGKKRMLVFVMGVYAVAVTVAGFTPDIGQAFGVSRLNQIYLLIAVRGFQGIGMAMFPLAFAIIGEEFPPNRVGAAQGIVSAMFAAGATIGLLGGAWITQDFGWRTTYHTVIPAAIVLLILTILIVRESSVRLRQPLDIPGSAFLGIALATALTGVSEGPYWGWGTWSAVTIGGVGFGVPELFVLAVIFTAAFLLWEPRVRNPIVDFARLKERNIAISNVVAVIAGASMFLVFVANSILIQIPAPVGLGYTVLQSGLLSLPTSIAMMLLAPIVGRSIATTGPKPIMIGGSLLVVLGGVALAAFNIHLLVPGVPATVFTTIPVLVGVIFCFIAMTNIVVLSSRREETGIQTGMNATFRTLGQCLGPVLATTVLSSYTAAVSPYGPQGPTLVLPTLVAFQYVYLLAALLGVVSTVLCFFLINYKFRADGTRAGVETPRAAPAVASVAAVGGPEPIATTP